jgi:hypothetical protein
MNTPEQGKAGKEGQKNKLIKVPDAAKHLLMHIRVAMVKHSKLLELNINITYRDPGHNQFL